MDFFKLDNYDLVNKYKNLINGMNSFTADSKAKYKEAWNRRCKDKEHLELVLDDRCIDKAFILKNDLSDIDCNALHEFGTIVFNYTKMLKL